MNGRTPSPRRRALPGVPGSPGVPGHPAQDPLRPRPPVRRHDRRVRAHVLPRNHHPARRRRSAARRRPRRRTARVSDERAPSPPFPDDGSGSLRVEDGRGRPDVGVPRVPRVPRARRARHPRVVLQQQQILLPRVQRLRLDADVQRGGEDERGGDAEHRDAGDEVPRPKLRRGEIRGAQLRETARVRLLVQAVPHAARHRERGDHAGLRPVAQVRAAAGAPPAAPSSVVVGGVARGARVARRGLERAPECDALALRGHEGVARVLPVLPRARAVGPVPAPERVPPGALGHVRWRARDFAPGTFVDDAVLARGQRLEALGDAPAAPGEVRVPDRRVRVPVLPVGHAGSPRVRDAAVLAHVHVQVRGRRRGAGGGGRRSAAEETGSGSGSGSIVVFGGGGDVEEEGGVLLVRAERVRPRVAAARAREDLAVFPPGAVRARERRLLAGRHEAVARAPLGLEALPVRRDFVRARRARDARAAVHPGPSEGTRVRAVVRDAVRAVRGVRAPARPQARVVLARGVVRGVRVAALCGGEGGRASAGARWRSEEGTRGFSGGSRRRGGGQATTRAEANARSVGRVERDADATRTREGGGGGFPHPPAPKSRARVVRLLTRAGRRSHRRAWPRPPTPRPPSRGARYTRTTPGGGARSPSPRAAPPTRAAATAPCAATRVKCASYLRD